MLLNKISSNLILTIGLGFSMASGLSVYAADSAGPNFFIKGNFEGCSWTSLDYPMTKEGNKYSIKLQNVDGEFKISNEDWTINYGGNYVDSRVISESQYYGGLHSGENFKAANIKDLEISFDYQEEAKNVTIKFVVDGIEPSDVSNDFRSGTLPVLYINVYDENGNLDNEIISKDLAHKNYFTGNYWLDVNGCEWMKAMGAESIGSKEEPLPLEIKARGNFTRTGFSKKPFKLKLGKKQSMLGLSKSKHFAILAHADDNKGYLRNFTGFNLGNRIGLPWTPSQQPVEVVINGDYRGLYFLTESIRVESGRVDIAELDDNVSDPTLISGGYIVELDNYDEENQIRMVEKGQAPGYKDMLRITFDTPEEYSEIQTKFVTDQFTAMNDAIGANSDNLWAYMDMDDAARYYLVEEIISHTESYHGSTYLFRDRGEGQKWHFSPLWDCGNAFNGPSNDYFTNHSPFGNTWIASMRLNKKFMNKICATWKWFMSSEFDGLYEDIDQYVSNLKEAANSDYKRWTGQPVPFNGWDVVDNRDIEDKAKDVKTHLSQKIDWMKSQFGEFADSAYAEPERDDTPAAPLPLYIISGVESILSPAGELNENYQVFTLEGVKVENPQPGNIYIILRNGNAQKVLVK